MGQRAVLKHERPAEPVAVDGATSHGRPELRCYHLPLSMLNSPSSWVWFAHRARQPHPPKATRKTILTIQKTPPPVQTPQFTQQYALTQGPPPTQRAGFTWFCHINGCGKPLADEKTAANHALRHLRLVRPWTSDMIDATELSLNESAQLRGCCEACGGVFLPGQYLADHLSSHGSSSSTLCCRRPAIDAEALYARCCALRDEAERSVHTVCIRAAAAPAIRVLYDRDPGGTPISATATAYVLATVHGAHHHPTGSGAAEPAAVYRPVPITDAFGTLDRLKAAYLVPRERRRGEAPPLPPSPATRQHPSGSGQAPLEVLLTSPLPFWYRDGAGMVPHDDQDQDQAGSSGGEGSESGSDGGSDSGSRVWSGSEGDWARF